MKCHSQQTNKKNNKQKYVLRLQEHSDNERIFDDFNFVLCINSLTLALNI